MEKKISCGAPTKNAPLWIFISYNLPRGNKAGVSLDFNHVWIGQGLYQIWCFIQNFHYGCAYTPYYQLQLTFKEILEKKIRPLAYMRGIYKCLQLKFIRLNKRYLLRL